LEGATGHAKIENRARSASAESGAGSERLDLPIRADPPPEGDLPVLVAQDEAGTGCPGMVVLINDAEDGDGIPGRPELQIGAAGVDEQGHAVLPVRRPEGQAGEVVVVALEGEIPEHGANLAAVVDQLEASGTHHVDRRVRGIARTIAHVSSSYVGTGQARGCVRTARAISLVT